MTLMVQNRKRWHKESPKGNEESKSERMNLKLTEYSEQKEMVQDTITKCLPKAKQNQKVKECMSNRQIDLDTKGWFRNEDS